MRRSNNQDAHAEVPADSPDRLRSRGHLFLVADGMGAHAAGELASRIAAEQIPLHYLRQSTADPIVALREAVEQANSDIHRRGQQNREFHNMGTTASSLAILADGVIIAHVGDSRIYRLRGNRLEQLTFDHSLIWEMQASGQIKHDSQLSGSIPKNIITRSLGPAPDVKVDIEGPFPVQPGDRFLLCSDGLTGQVDDAEIGPLVAALNPDLAARVLVDLANLRGGPDNITVIVVDVREYEPPPGERRLMVPAARRLPWAMIGATLICLLAAAVLEVSGNRGGMIVAAVLGAIAAGIAGFQAIRARPHKPAKVVNDELSGSRRSSPYRTSSAKPTAEILEKLDDVLSALREAAQERRWLVDWAQVDSSLADNQTMRLQGRLAEVIQLQAQAIVQTMSQLRSQQRGNGETVTG